MKHLKKISSIVLALMMVLTMGASVFATDTGVSTGNTFTLEKEILVFNDESIKVYGPGITYTYAVTEGLEGKTVTDADGHTAVVKAGIEDGLTLSSNTIAFSQNELVDASLTGTAVTKDITVGVDLNKFEGEAAGIYRYKITETAGDLVGAAMTRPSGYIADRYVDIYLRNKNNGDGLEVAGIVVFIGDANIDGETANNNKITGKTTGFVDTYDKDITDDVETDGSGMADKYYTYNYSLTKEVTGAMADKTNPFEFKIATAGVANQNFTYKPADGKDAVGTIGTLVTTNLSHGQTLEIKGLPANATINVTEKNNTPDTYTVSAEDKAAGELIPAEAVGANVEKSTGEKAVSEYATNKTTKPDASLKATTFVNNLDEVSPTNVVMRFAPYLFILGGAMLLLVASRRRKAEQE